MLFGGGGDAAAAAVNIKINFSNEAFLRLNWVLELGFKFGGPYDTTRFIQFCV